MTEAAATEQLRARRCKAELEIKDVKTLRLPELTPRVPQDS